MPLHDVLRQRVQPITAVFTSNRIVLYSLLSAFALAATVANASRSHSNFYSVSIFLANSSRSVLILANFGFLSSLLIARILKSLFFGSLQPREVERLYDQTWMFVTESLLAFTIFRDEFDVPFLLMFGFLLFVKCFHWLMADRVESIDQTTYPGPPTLFHIRINSLFALLWAVDLVMFTLAIENTRAHGVGGMVLFASEYAILLASAFNAFLRYSLSIIDLRRARLRGGENAPPWEHKSMYIFYVELITDFIKLSTYMTFFLIILAFYGLPLNILRDFFFTARSFITRLRALVRYLNATRDMDRRYPDATEAELSEMSDRTCIICREEMHPRNPQPAVVQDATVQDANPQPQPLPPADGPNVTPKKLPCGHIFHFQCLRSWLERQQSCPTCRRTVLETNPPPNQPPAQGQPRLAPPRPGAAPIPAAAPNGQQQAPVPPPVNPLGWVGRVLGVPPLPAPPPPAAGAQGQPAPGAFQHPQPLPNPQWVAPAAPAQPHAPPGPRTFWQQALPEPPPMFRGFYGPGQAWQPWGDPRWFAPPPPGGPPGEQPQDLPAPATAQPPAESVPTPDERQQPRITDASQASTSASAPTSANVAGDASQPRGASEGEHEARVAAGLAALRRLRAATDSDASRTDSPPIHSPSTSAGNGSTGTSTTTGVPAAEAHAARESPAAAVPMLPALIPLFDPNIQQQQPTRGPGASPYTPYNFVPLPGPRSTFYRARASPTARDTGAARAPPTMGELPQRLTEAQLARLDRLTRDAIDERLRVLEGVSGAVSRCVEELTRLRSVLPQADGRGGGERREGETEEERVRASRKEANGKAVARESGDGDGFGGEEDDESALLAAIVEAQEI